MDVEMNGTLPDYYEKLSDQDKKGYAFLKKTFASSSCKNRRNRGNQTFLEILDGLKAFIVRGDDGDSNRSLVCGICWLQDSIAINVRQLSHVLSKSKSSINGSFQQLGYGTIPTGAGSAAALIKVFPFLDGNYPELRKWTVRQLMSHSPQPAKLTELIQMTYNKPKFITPPPDFNTNVEIDGLTIGSLLNKTTTHASPVLSPITQTVNPNSTPSPKELLSTDDLTFSEYFDFEPDF